MSLRGGALLPVLFSRDCELSPKPDGQECPSSGVVVEWVLWIAVVGVAWWDLIRAKPFFGPRFQF